MVDGGNKQVLFLFYLGAFLKLSTIVRLPKMCNPPLSKKAKAKKKWKEKINECTNCMALLPETSLNTLKITGIK